MQDDGAACVRRSRVVLTPRRWRQVLRRLVRLNRAGQNLQSARRRWQKSPIAGESTKETVKTIACGNAGRFRCDRCEYSCAFLEHHSAHEAAGASCTRHSPRPLWAKDSSTPRPLRVARTKSYPELAGRHCERSEAIHRAAKRKMDCFATLAMTAEMSDMLFPPSSSLRKQGTHQ